MPSASELLNSIQETIGLKKKKPPEALAAAPMPVESLRVPPVVSVTPAPEAGQAVTPGPIVTGAPPAQELVPAAATPASSELPDWLSAPSAVEPTPAPTMESAVAPAATPDWLKGEKTAVEESWPPVPLAPLPESEAPVVETPAVEAPVVGAPVPVAAVEAKTEADPFVVNREFNGYMETIRQAQAILTSGFALTPEEQKKALIAVARSNSLLPKLPPEVLESVLLMRAVASGNPKFGRDDFQREILVAMDVIKTGTAVKG